MNNKDKWKLLFEDKRFREKSTTTPSDGRTPFESDYGRLISSAPIRRLQDKTQVFPLESNDYIRTRLTHSLEVSYIGGSIGQSIEMWLIQKGDMDVNQRGYLSSLLRTSGLVHDLGNPPFGHFGEEAIKDFFRHYFEQDNHGLRDIEIADLVNFDGNVQTFRILTRLYFFGDEFSYNLTYTTLSSVVKYPSNSLEGNKSPFTEIAKKKFGYFVTETEKYKAINDHLQLHHRRCPVVYLMEAADDIAYTAADIEDGIKLGIISVDDIYSVFEKSLTGNKEEVMAFLDKLKKEFENEPKNRESIMVQKFRIKTQQLMIEAVLDVFKDKYDLIMNGELEDELIMQSSAKDIRLAYKKLTSMIFNSKSILKKELAGWEAIKGLLEIFVSAAESPNFKASGNCRESRLYNIISLNYRTIYERYPAYNNNMYNRLRLIVDYISGMTDRHAITLFQELKGIKL